MKEVFKDIPDYEGLYQVSDQGRVKSLNYLHTRKEGILKPCYDTDGYLMVTLYKDGKRKMHKVHRLVAITHIPNPENKPEVNHKHGIKTDNRANELEWATISENVQHAYDTGLTKHYTRKVLQYDLQGNLIKEWGSIVEASKQLGIKHRNSITKCCNGTYKTSHNYIWKYADTK